MTAISTGNAYLDSLAQADAATKAASTKKSQTVDQAGFLKLLTTQLKTQDPTEPVDNSQMVAQMAQFSSVTGITEMNQSLKSMASDLAAARFGDASGWIGRAALLKSGTATALSNGAFAGEITLPSDAKALTMALVDQDGQAVYSHDFGAHAAGVVEWGWDGKDQAGNPVAGPLRLLVTAADAKGPIDVSTASWNEIQSVQSPASGTTTLITALGSFKPADVLQLA